MHVIYFMLSESKHYKVQMLFTRNPQHIFMALKSNVLDSVLYLVMNMLIAIT